LTTWIAERPAPRGRSGYSLVELAVVFAIVGILAAVGGSQYVGYLDRARTARAIVELQAIAAQIDPAGDEDASWPASLAAAGISTVDPWGNPYQYLLIAGNLPIGLADSATGLPPVAAAPGNPGASAHGGDSIMAAVRKDRFLAPINTDFDLYSMGPDGESRPQLNAAPSRDDIVRAANGSYYGVAEGF
jgi:general secretion pathway protein G